MPYPSSQPLPPYRGILAVDIERFTGNPSYHQPDLSAAIQESLQTAFDHCGMPELWERRPQTGDSRWSWTATTRRGRRQTPSSGSGSAIGLARMAGNDRARYL
jgi:hypothetical protein